ncbi:hypothetical protein CDIK_1316 [Cucumispora dikerogammari]|nr:hypothetical protein CDIK_1316 [Cucumispora dikerogammari]
MFTQLVSLLQKLHCSSKDNITTSTPPEIVDKDEPSTRKLKQASFAPNNYEFVRTLMELTQSSSSVGYKIPEKGFYNYLSIFTINIETDDVENQIDIQDSKLTEYYFEYLKKSEEKNPYLYRSEKTVLSTNPPTERNTNSFIKYFKKFPQKYFKMSFVFSEPIHEIIYKELNKFIQQLKKHVAPLKEILENETRNRNTFFHNSKEDCSGNQKKQTEKRNMEIQAEFVREKALIEDIQDIPKKLKSSLVNYLASVNDLYEYDCSANMSLSDSYIDELHIKRHESFKKFFKKAKSFIKKTFERIIQLSEISQEQKKKVYLAIKKVIDKYPLHIYFLTDIFVKINDALPQATEFIFLETPVFRLNAISGLLEQVDKRQSLKQNFK